MKQDETKVNIGGMPNVYYLLNNREVGDYDNYEVHPHAKDFVDLVTGIDPSIVLEAQWLTRIRPPGADIDDESWRRTAYAIAFVVTMKGEKLGRVYVDKRVATGEKLYCAENFRISASRNRGSAYKTKDIKKSLAAIKKFFVPKNIREYASENIYMLARVVRNWKETADIRFERKFRKLLENDEVRANIVRDLPAFISKYIPNETQIDFEKLIGELPELERLATRLDEILPNSYLVCIKDDLVAFKRWEVLDDPEGYEVVHRDDLPENLKCGIGMLKLVADKTVVPQVGYRLNERTFFVCPELNEGVDADN